MQISCALCFVGGIRGQVRAGTRAEKAERCRGKARCPNQPNPKISKGHLQISSKNASTIGIRVMQSSYGVDRVDVSQNHTVGPQAHRLASETRSLAVWVVEVHQPWNSKWKKHPAQSEASILGLNHVNLRCMFLSRSKL